MLILDLWGISFHAVVVFGLGKNLLLKSALGHCEFMIKSHQELFTRQIAIQTFRKNKQIVHKIFSRVVYDQTMRRKKIKREE